jgi:hypothetical protein
LDVFGTGFLVSGKGQILTNHHVAEPWWNNDDLKEMTDQGVEPMLVEMTAYFPGMTRGISGLDAILARTGEETLRSIASATRGNPKQVMQELARRHLIRARLSHRAISATSYLTKSSTTPKRHLAALAVLFSTARAKSSELTLP